MCLVPEPSAYSACLGRHPWRCGASPHAHWPDGTGASDHRSALALHPPGQAWPSEAETTARIHVTHCRNLIIWCTVTFAETTARIYVTHCQNRIIWCTETFLLCVGSINAWPLKSKSSPECNDLASNTGPTDQIQTVLRHEPL